ncbi:MAG TPA: DUF899 family protein [Solirubrobacterales bacterium]
MPHLLVDGRWHRRSPAAPACPRSHAAVRFAGATGEASGVQAEMGWSIPWVSSANNDFSFDLGASYTEEQVREQMAQVDERELPPIARHNATATGTDLLGYVSEIPAMSAFTLQDGAVYQTYATTWRGVEFLMGYYPILDRAPKGRDEGDAFQTWIRRHDEYV